MTHSDKLYVEQASKSFTWIGTLEKNNQTNKNCLLTIIVLCFLSRMLSDNPITEIEPEAFRLSRTNFRV